MVNKLRKSVHRDIQLSEYDDKKTRDHFSKKLKFYLMQNKTKWRHWPNKGNRKTQANFHRKQKRRKKKTEDDARRALESGSVVVLIEQVPNGALALLGKGLNFTPTPSIDVREEQLDMRLNTNRILQAADKSCENETNIKLTLPGNYLIKDIQHLSQQKSKLSTTLLTLLQVSTMVSCGSEVLNLGKRISPKMRKKV